MKAVPMIASMENHSAIINVNGIEYLLIWWSTTTPFWGPAGLNWNFKRLSSTWDIYCLTPSKRQDVPQDYVEQIS